jgi:hypothetical protein
MRHYSAVCWRYVVASSNFPLPKKNFCANGAAYCLKLVCEVKRQIGTTWLLSKPTFSSPSGQLDAAHYHSWVIGISATPSFECVHGRNLAKVNNIEFLSWLTKCELCSCECHFLRFGGHLEQSQEKPIVLCLV